MRGLALDTQTNTYSYVKQMYNCQLQPLEPDSKMPFDNNAQREFRETDRIEMIEWTCVWVNVIQFVQFNI